MTAEEYLETRRCNSAVSKKCDMCYMDAAYIAIEIAKQEERENAVKQLQIVLTAIVARNDNKISFGDVIDQFDKLLNQ